MMDRLVKFFAPRGVIDFVTKVFCIQLALGGMNWVRDQIEHGATADSFANNFFEAAFVGILPTVLSLAVVGHLSRLQKSLEEAVLTDPLTNLPNRRSFFEQIRSALPAGRNVLLMLDADHFKDVNDQFGHSAGDQCLVQIADLLRANLRREDLVARLGGEEFAVLLVGATEETARKISNRLVAGVKLNITGPGFDHTVTLSIGAIRTAADDDITELLKQADHALYQAKAAGRGRVIFAEPLHGPGFPGFEDRARSA